MTDEITNLYMTSSGLEQLDKRGGFFNDASNWGKTDPSKNL